MAKMKFTQMLNEYGIYTSPPEIDTIVKFISNSMETGNLCGKSDVKILDEEGVAYTIKEYSIDEEGDICIKIGKSIQI